MRKLREQRAEAKVAAATVMHTPAMKEPPREPVHVFVRDEISDLGKSIRRK